jgi:hypothetical protein
VTVGTESSSFSDENSYFGHVIETRGPEELPWVTFATATIVAFHFHPGAFWMMISALAELFN